MVFKQNLCNFASRGVNIGYVALRKSKEKPATKINYQLNVSTTSQHQTRFLKPQFSGTC